MNWLRVLLWRVRGIGRTRQLDRDLRDQVDAHLEEATGEFLARGLSPSDARRAALRSFGSVVHVEETSRDIHGRWLLDLRRDIRYGLRSLRRNRAFSAVAIGSLAVGIGANTAIFSVVNSMVLRPRPVANPDELVELYVGHRGHPYETTSYPSYVDLRERNEVLTGLAAYGIRQFKLTGDDDVEQLWGEVVSSNYFDVLGVQPRYGRSFGDTDAGVVIGHGLWQRRFNADPQVIGRPISINNQTVTIIGVAAPQFTGMMRGISSELWIPASAMPLLEPGRALVESRGSRWLVLVGRLKPDTSVEQASAHFDLLTREMQEKYPEEWKSSQGDGTIRELFVTVLTERDARIRPDVQTDAFALVALLVTIVNLVLLIACMNLAGMLLARAVVRRREIAIRLSLGASRWRIIRQLVTESVILSLIAGAAGVALTVWMLELVVASMPALPEGIRLALDLGVDWRVLLYAIGFSTVTGVLFGLAPALQSSRTDVSTTLKDDSGAFATGHRKSRSRRALVVAQVAFSLLLLIGAGLVLRSVEKLRPTRLGFQSENVVTAFLTLDETQYDRRRSQEFYRQLSERVASLPGVQTVSLVQDVPGGFLGGSRRSTEIEGYQPAPGESLEIASTIAGPRYFTNMKVPIVQGRDFDERDREGAPCVAIVNEAFVRRYLAGSASPLGKHLAKFDGDLPKQMCEIVGVIRDDRWQSLKSTVRPFHALALQQSLRRRMTLLVSTAVDPATQIRAVRQVIRGLDSKMPVNDVQTLGDLFSAGAYPLRVLGIVMGACGLLALLLATIGVYGIVSHSVAQRTREVGIRMALGALNTDVLRLVVGQGIRLVAWGLALGLVLSFALTRVLTSSLFDTGLLFGVTATDTITFAGMTILLAGVAFVACYVPAQRAAKVDPIRALRYE